MESFALLSISGAPAPSSSARRSSPEPPCPSGPPGPPGEPAPGWRGGPRAAGGPAGDAAFSPPLPNGHRRSCGRRRASPGRPSAPGAADSLPALAPAAGAPADPLGGEPPARHCTVYRPWFSPYSYFVCAQGGARQEAGSPSASPAGSAGEPDPPDDLSEIVCSSSCSPDEPRPAESGRPARSAGGAWDSVTVQDILAASQWQLAPQDGYKCVACCRVFPTLWSLKTHIRHGAREGFSCKVYYRKLKALWEKERPAQEAFAPAAPL
ncbi:spermatogenesis-associated protein 46 [Struthio camelus]|uniref:spermatogenesis-associated protein 46 n=1 Tax=Struthio camelus TaxID=8801 RepID=UPI003603DB94